MNHVGNATAMVLNVMGRSVADESGTLCVSSSSSERLRFCDIWCCCFFTKTHPPLIEAHVWLQCVPVQVRYPVLRKAGAPPSLSDLLERAVRATM